MGQVCAKNKAGEVTNDIGRIKRGGRELPSSSQAQDDEVLETKFVRAQINFKLDKGVDKKADDLAMETANKWCADNPGWVYTGSWKNERN